MDPLLSRANLFINGLDSRPGTTLNGPPYFDGMGTHYNTLPADEVIRSVGGLFDIFGRPIIYGFVPVPGYQERLNAQISSTEEPRSDQEHQPPDTQNAPEQPESAQRNLPEEPESAQSDVPEEIKSDLELLFDESFLYWDTIDKAAVHECFERCVQSNAN